jgi:hypothetical protein
MQKSKPNFIRLDPGLPEITILVTAMLQARAAAKHRPWSLPQEPTTESWWADVLAGPSARRPRQPRGFYRRGGEPQPVMVAPAILRTTDLSSQITPVIK